VIAKLRERLSVSKRTTRKFYMKRIDLRKLHDAEAKKHFQVKISIFAALKKLL
jgi:hypothetical protein